MFQSQFGLNRVSTDSDNKEIALKTDTPTKIAVSHAFVKLPPQTLLPILLAGCESQSEVAKNLFDNKLSSSSYQDSDGDDAYYSITCNCSSLVCDSDDA